MTDPSSRHFLIALCGLCFLLTVSAYQSGAARAALAATVTDAATDAATASGAGSFSLDAPTVGLAALSSYKAALVFTYTGTRQGQSGHWSKTYTMLANQKPAARQVTIETAGDPASVSMWEMNGVQYVQPGPNSCTASPVEKGNSLADQWEPARFLSRFNGAELVGSETSNGLPANHYKFDGHAVGAAQATGDVWVASSGGYVVKYVLSIKAGADYFGDGADGTATWDYELTGVNQPLAVVLPKNCPIATLDAPMLPDAANLVKMPGILSYSTATSLADATAFYQKQLVAAGWQVGSPPDVTDTTALLIFTQGAQHLSVVIATADGSTTVQIELVSASTGPSLPARPPTRTPVPTRTRVPTRTPLPTKTPKP